MLLWYPAPKLPYRANINPNSLTCQEGEPHLKKTKIAMQLLAMQLSDSGSQDALTPHLPI